MITPAGRYAPSPSGDLHFGNLRTAVLAWLWARHSHRRFLMRIEDIDTQRSSAESAARQLEDLTALGLDWDELSYQSERLDSYAAAIERLDHYECYCSRKDIQAASAPHGAPGAYPGTCRDLSEAEREARRAQLRALNRQPALRLRAQVSEFGVVDERYGRYTGAVDDMILRRGDGDYAYNLAVVCDDGVDGVDQVVRGDDLLSSAPRQAYLASLLGYEQPRYVHVPLVLNEEGKRLAKRDGAVTFREMDDVFAHIARSIGAPGARDLAHLLQVWEPSMLPAEPWIFHRD